MVFGVPTYLGGKRGKRKARLGHCINAKDWHIFVGYLACMLGGILQGQETTEWSRKNRGGPKFRQASFQMYLRRRRRVKGYLLYVYDVLIGPARLGYNTHKLT